MNQLTKKKNQPNWCLSQIHIMDVKIAVLEKIVTILLYISCLLNYFSSQWTTLIHCNYDSQFVFQNYTLLRVTSNTDFVENSTYNNIVFSILSMCAFQQILWFCTRFQTIRTVRLHPIRYFHRVWSTGF